MISASVALQCSFGFNGEERTRAEELPLALYTTNNVKSAINQLTAKRDAPKSTGYGLFA